MGGEGSMMAANQSLKTNRDSRRKDRRKFIGLTSVRSETTEYNFPTASKEKLKKMRQRLLLDNKIRNVKIILFSSVVFLILAGFFFYYY